MAKIEPLSLTTDSIEQATFFARRPVSKRKAESWETEMAIPVITHVGIATTEPPSKFNHKVMAPHSYTDFFQSLPASFFKRWVEASREALEEEIKVERRNKKAQDYWRDVKERFNAEMEKRHLDKS